jgi:hypothetical protein
LPFGIPGIGDEIDGAVQQAPQSARQDSLSIRNSLGKSVKNSAGADSTGSERPAVNLREKVLPGHAARRGFGPFHLVECVFSYLALLSRQNEY